MARALKEDFKRILELADKAALTEQERLLYEQEEKNLRDIVNQVEYAQEKGYEQGKEEGIKEGKLQTAAALKKEGLSIDMITKANGLTIEEIDSI